MLTIGILTVYVKFELIHLFVWEYGFLKHWLATYKRRGDYLKSALITGVTGQDGSYLSEFLLKKGYDVHGIIRRSSVDYVLLNPNEVGVLMLDYICRKIQDNHATTPIFMKTIVTTSMAEKYGLKVINTLTGFKYIGERIEELKSGEEFVFAMEESCGYLSNSQIRDKDGVNAALLISVVLQEYKNKGLTLYGRMQELYREYGYFLNSQKNYKFDGVDGVVQMKSIMDKIHMPLPEYDGINIVSGIDYSEGYRGLPPANMREYKLSDGSRFLIRPSGTEPKLKVYIEAVGKDFDEAQSIESAIKEYIDRIIGLQSAYTLQ